MSKPGGPDTMPVNIICPSHFGQCGRSIAVRLSSGVNSVCGMMLPWRWRERENKALDALIRTVKYPIYPSTAETLSNIDQF
jgi:hypothetical protein